jgi:type 1 glutamine amidotransferase
MINRRKVIAVAAGLLVMAGLALASDATPPRVLVVTGGHEFEPEFHGMFEGGWCEVTRAGSNEEAFAVSLAGKYDVVVLYDMNQELSDSGKANLKAWLGAGGGVVVLHHALVSYNGWEWWRVEVTGASYREQESPGMPASTYKHDTEMKFSILKAHPVTAGLESWSMLDETYGGMWYGAGLDVLIESDSHQGPAPAVWLGPWGESRVVCIQPGHGREAFENEHYRRLLRQAVIWAAAAGE